MILATATLPESVRSPTIGIPFACSTSAAIATRTQAIGIPIVEPATTEASLTPAPGIPLHHDPVPPPLPLAAFGALALCEGLLGAALGAAAVEADGVGTGA
jgi:hypothetical protein